MSTGPSGERLTYQHSESEVQFTTRLKKPVFTKKSLTRSSGPAISPPDRAVVQPDLAPPVDVSSTQQTNNTLASPDGQDQPFDVSPVTPKEQTGDRFEDNPLAAHDAVRPISDEQIVSLPNRRKRQGIASPIELGFTGTIPARDESALADVKDSLQDANYTRDATTTAETLGIDPEESILDSYGDEPLADPDRAERPSSQTIAHRRYQSQQSTASSFGSIDASSPTAAQHPMPTLHTTLDFGSAAAAMSRAESSDAGLASNLRKRFEGQKQPFQLGAALPIDTAVPKSRATPDTLSPIATDSSPGTSALSSPSHASASTLPNLPKGMSLKQLRASQAASYSFPRRSPASTPNRLTVNARRSASANDAKAATFGNLEPLPSPSVGIDPHFRRSPAWMEDERSSAASTPVVDTHLVPVSPGWRERGSASPASSTFSHDDRRARPPRSPGGPSSPLTKSHRPLHSEQSYFPGKVPSPMPRQFSNARPAPSPPDIGSKKLVHSRSFSGLSRSSSLVSKRRPSLPTNASSKEADAVVQLGNTQFEFVSATPSKASEPRDNLYASTSSASVLAGWQTPDNGTATDYETDNDMSDHPSRQLVTRPTPAAKERIHSMYIRDQYEEPALQTDKYGFVHQNDPRAVERELEMSQPQDPKALEAYRARELKVRPIEPLPDQLMLCRSGYNAWVVSRLNRPRNRRKLQNWSRTGYRTVCEARHG